MLSEQILIYSIVLLFCAAIVFFYLRKLKSASKVVEAKIEKAKQEGLHEPVSLLRKQRCGWGAELLLDGFAQLVEAIHASPPQLRPCSNSTIAG